MERVDLFGISFCNVTFDDVCQELSVRIRERRPGYVVTPNVDHVCNYHRDPYFRGAYEEACLIVADGTPLLWAARILGTPLRQKLSGSDLLPRLCDFAAREGFAIFLFGAPEGVAVEAAHNLAQRIPALRIAGTYAPPMQFEANPYAHAEALERLRSSNADICFVAMGSPRQEIWMQRNQAASGIPVMIGVGAAIDFAAGRIRRAPVWMQRAGLEWFWRLCQEPRRLWRRYLVQDMLFFRLLWKDFWASLPKRLGWRRR